MSESNSKVRKYTSITLVVVSVLLSGYCLFGVLRFNPTHIVVKNNPVFLSGIHEAESLNLIVARYRPQFVFDSIAVVRADTVACVATDAFITMQATWNSAFFASVERHTGVFNLTVKMYESDAKGNQTKWFVREPDDAGDFTTMRGGVDELHSGIVTVLKNYECTVYKNTVGNFTNYKDTCIWRKELYHRVGVLRLQKIEYSY
ncbi:MAG: hypothetical protein QY319_03435 [Candidatus Kapaibacterium sp.]|nr:MAG: hypothetical protein F9K28_11470 [Bacteroidota bacterium]KXK10353.1 MAG: hypothetical protein UZ22_OP11002000807 [Microgenomates bacterium OLB23]MBZ0194261.1 hypothetical protein [Candidatus Kapabacteria bacterium]QOJ26976.1 MAG: hypothetical protein HRU79_10110 [Ignavibacteria bacterium]WKZ78475.1 MAG: hypothetical protein QY319_03435 [Candidatus Kapabacteria bacterium]